MRADQLLVERGLAATRSQAQRLIAAGVQWFDGAAWKRVAKNGDELPEAAQLELLDTAESRYVSRGGLKLEGALRATALDVTGWNCLDVGQSTGGFTDCLLQHGAARVELFDRGDAPVAAQPRSKSSTRASSRAPRSAVTSTWSPATCPSSRSRWCCPRWRRCCGAVATS